MPAKHRCHCFSNGSNSFLYDLRRETPSTDRVLKERLLNVLSRAAANKSKNPQRLWAEMPPWWPEVTVLKWKNPREHPKDNKDTLNQKIEILERQLKQRGLMTKEVEDELQANKEGKRFDLELKSDFEAVIAKASGLHYMVNKVNEKMGSSRVISNRLADYIRGVKACMEKCLHSIDFMFKQVEDREIRKSLLWEKMGVKKQEGPRDDAIKRPWSEMYVSLESNNLLIDCEESPLPEPHFLAHTASRTPSPTSPDPPFLSQTASPVSSPQQGLVARHVLPDLPLFGRRASEIAVAKSSLTESDLQRLKDTAIPVLPTSASSAKKSRRQSTDDANEPVTMKQRAVSPPTFLKTHIEQRRHTQKRSLGMKSAGLEEDESAPTPNLSISYLLHDVRMPASDVSAFSGSTEQLDLLNIVDYETDFSLSVDNTFEESDMKAMDSLAEQAKALSFDDLRPSVTEHINVRLPSRSLSDGMTEHSVQSIYISPDTSFLGSCSCHDSYLATPAPVATAIKKESLSVAIANFLN